MNPIKPFYNFFRTCILCAVISLLLPVSSFSQHYNFKSYSVEDGLSQSQVNSIFQDKKGNLWIGTATGGVCKYDGVSFVNYTKKDGLADNNVYSIIEDRKGNLWFGTDGGVTKYDGKNFVTYTVKDGLCYDNILKIMEDRDGNMWMGSNGGGVSKFDGVKFINYGEKEGLNSPVVWSIMQDNTGDIWFGTLDGVNRFDGKKIKNYSMKDGLPGNAVYSIYQDRLQHIWLGTNKGLSRFTESRFINYTVKDGLPHNGIWSIAEDRSGHIWLGTNSGLSQFNGFTFTNYTTNQGLSHNTIYCILEDREGNLWCGTNGGGINKYSRRCFASYTTEDGLSNDIVNSIFQDKQNNFWFATFSGVTKFDGKNYTNYNDKNGLIHNKVWSIFQDLKGNIWFGTGGGLSMFDGKKFNNYSSKDGIIGQSVYSILQDKKGNLWFATRGGIVAYDGKNFHSYTEKEGLLENVVRQVFEDHNGNIWFATNAGVLKLLSKTADLINPKFLIITEKEGLINKKVISIAEDKKGNMWFGTNGGINVYSPLQGLGKKSILDTITVRDGLSDDGIVLMKFDKKDNLWIGTSKGISKLDMAQYNKTGKKVFKHYSKADGFSGVECNQNAVYEDKTGQIWFGTIKGAIKYIPLEDKINQVAPSTHITNIRLFFENADLLAYADSLNKETGLPVNLKLPYKKNHVTFDFIGISLAVPEKVRYQYILEGLDKGWSPITKENHAIYPTLPHGDYIFKVKACNSDGIWNEEPQSFSFSITPPIWLRTWFIILCIIVGLGSIYIVLQLRLKNLVKQHRILEEKVELRTKELKEEKEKVEEINLEVISQKEIIERKNKDITDSIHYAKRIQEAILPTKSLILKALPDSFVMFRPKDIVSGDFYWFAVNKDKILIAAVDCTGHGVPGAFMSMIGNTLLNEIVLEKGIVNPAEILNNLHVGVRLSLKQNLDDAETNDGMDVALCAIDLNKNEVEYAAAYRPLYHISNGVLNEIKGDKFAIGGSHIEEKRLFKNNIFKINKGDSIYLFTDGYADQFGGKDGKKFLSKRFQQLLISINDIDMAKQEYVLDERINNWRGKEEQIDDILVVGIKL